MLGACRALYGQQQRPEVSIAEPVIPTLITRRRLRFTVTIMPASPIAAPPPMKKKSAHAKMAKSATPQSAQLDAVRKLSRSGRHEEAQTRVAELRARYPDFKPLLALAWEVDDAAGYRLSARLHA